MHKPKVIVVGGGAAGFFAAVTCAQAHPRAQVTVLELGRDLLTKVRISGGGRCNVTNACFDPARLVGFYPRGGKALRGPLTRFGPRETVEWFESRGVKLKTEPDGRMFPITDRSETIIDCLKEEAGKSGVVVRTETRIRKIDPGFSIQLESGETLECDRLLLATGNGKKGWEWAAQLGHTIVPTVPSLFTFTISDPRLEGLAGVSVPDGAVGIEGTKRVQTGPILVTHWGLSGPAVIKLSAWGARELHDRQYRADLRINWTGDLKSDRVRTELAGLKTKEGGRTVGSRSRFRIPQRLWERLAAAAGIPEGKRWGQVSAREIEQFTQELTSGKYEMTGKGVFKEEFVTAGGVSLKEVDFRTMESRIRPGLFFAGEILDIDGVTGGFNFQSCWTTAHLAGLAMGTA